MIDKLRCKCERRERERKKATKLYTDLAHHLAVGNVCFRITLFRVQSNFGLRNDERIFRVIGARLWLTLLLRLDLLLRLGLITSCLVRL